MGKVRYVVDTDNPPQLSEEAVARLNALDDRPIDYSDIPAATMEEIEIGRLLAIEMRKRQMFSLRLHSSTINWWKKTIGAGYTSVMARLLDKATKHPEWIKECL
jgi:hypothetical protein